MMAKEQAAAEASETTEFPLALDEFCTRLSRSDRRVELIGGFEHSERIAGRVKDHESAYAARYADFANKPA